MAGYTKLFNSILASTIWREDDKTRIVWITLLAMADKNGIADGSIPGLADFARVSVDDCRAALERLKQPDEDSRSKEHDGRRIAEVDGGWQILNHGKYRAKLNQDERREYLRIKQREYRRKQPSTKVNNVSHKSTVLTQPEAEAKADTKAFSREHAPRYEKSGSTEELRAGRLVDRYGELFQAHRLGARYRQRPNLDWLEALTLVSLWSDARLEKLAILVLTTDDPWISKTDRGFKIFAMKASWADEKLCAWEAEHGKVAL
jgi:hypothetical protein